MRCLPRVGAALTVLLMASGLPPTARAQDPITWRSLDCGGTTFSTAGSYELGGTIGQFDAGVLTGGAFTLRGGFWFGGQAPVTGVGDDETPPLVFRLFRSANPVRFQSRVAFQIPAASRVRLSIFDVAGRVAKEMDFGVLPAGRREQGWRAEDDAGRPLPNGVYWLRLEAGRERATQKVLIFR